MGQLTDIPAGLPQGGVLSPMLRLMFSNDLTVVNRTHSGLNDARLAQNCHDLTVFNDLSPMPGTADSTERPPVDAP